MPGVRAIKRRDLARNLARIGFEGPCSGGKQQFIVRVEMSVRIPYQRLSEVGEET